MTYQHGIVFGLIHLLDEHDGFLNGRFHHHNQYHIVDLNNMILMHIRLKLLNDVFRLIGHYQLSYVLLFRHPCHKQELLVFYYIHLILR